MIYYIYKYILEADDSIDSLMFKRYRSERGVIDADFIGRTKKISDYEFFLKREGGGFINFKIY